MELEGRWMPAAVERGGDRALFQLVWAEDGGQGHFEAPLHNVFTLAALLAPGVAEKLNCTVLCS